MLLTLMTSFHFDMWNISYHDVSDIRSKRDLTLCEVEDYETGTFARSTFAYIDEYDAASFGRNPVSNN